MANETNNVTNNANEGAPAPQEAQQGFKFPTKEQVVSGAKKLGNGFLKLCEITATVGAGVFGAVIIGATAKELLKPKTESDTPDALPEADFPVVTVTDDVLPDVDDIQAAE